MTFGERVQYRREKLGLTQSQLARLCGLKQPTISNIESGRNIASKMVVKLSVALRCSAVWLSTGNGPEEAQGARQIDSDEGDFIPVRRANFKLSAGVSGFSLDYQSDEGPPLFFRADWLISRSFAPDKLVAVKISGASMEPGLYDGDTVVINTAEVEPMDGEVFAVNYEGELVIKRLRRDEGSWWLSSDNTDKRRFGDKKVTEFVHLLGRAIYKSSERL